MTETNQIKEYFDDGFERLLTQQNENHSDNLAQLIKMNERITALEKTMGEWRFAGKVAMWLFLAIGGIITWALKTFGFHIGFKP